MILGVVAGLVLSVSPPDAGVRPKGALLDRPPKTAKEAEEQLALLEAAGGDTFLPALDAGPTIPPFRWKISNIIQEMPIDGPQIANDVPVKLHSLIVRGRREDVMIEILDHFRMSGLYVEDPSKQSQPTSQLQITGLDRDRAISYTAMVEGLANKTCMVVLGEANLGMASYTGLMRKSKKEEVKDFAPLMPDAVAPFRTDTEQMHTLAYSVAADEATAKKFYQQQFKQRGYTEVAPNVFLKGNEEIELVMGRKNGRLDLLLTLRSSKLK